MNYTDAETMMATQIAYLDYNGRHRGVKRNVGEMVDTILKKYGTYDQSSGTYVLKDGISGADKSQFETAKNVIRLSEQNGVDSWRDWSVVDGSHAKSGYYGCLIDTGDGNAIVGCRGSESYDFGAGVKDWGLADAGRLNNELTWQQSDATKYVEYLYEQYGDEYDSFVFTGHSLGGSLATHAAITAPEGMADKTDAVVSYDAPGFSDEYLRENRERIQQIRDKVYHYEYSWVGSLLFQPDGITNRVIKAHDDQDAGNPLFAQLYRHATYNVEFDENGNVIDGEKSTLQTWLGPVSQSLELTMTWMPMILHNLPFGLGVFSCWFDALEALKEDFFQTVEEIKENLNILYNNFISLMVSGDYEIHTSEMGQLSDDLKEAASRLKKIAEQVDEVKRTLPYDSLSAFYYKSCLWRISNDITSEGKRAGKIADVVGRVISKYHKGDQKVSTFFSKVY